MTTTTMRFDAPWGKLLWAFTALGTGVLGAAAIAMLPVSTLVSLGLAATVLFCAGGAVRGYRLEGDTLVIERLWRDKRVSLKVLTAVRHDEKHMHGSIRVGNGGLFVFSGYYWTKKLGWFRLHGNDILGRAVLLEIGDEKWMITPDRPAAFVAAAEKLIGRV